MIRELFGNQKPLMVAGTISFLCFAVLSVVSLFDPTEILGINRWIKPMKFFVSIAVLGWTTAVYLNFLNGYKKSASFISWTMIGIFFVEMFIIVMQALRGTTSHFNTKTPFDGILFAIMGVAVVINTLLLVHLLFLYFKAEIELPQAIIWGIRFGIILFLASCIEGGYMSQHLSHSVGIVDGGKGLPLINWSTEGGDLRVAHFVGMHALQVLPFFAYTLETYKVKDSTALTTIFAVLYFIFFTFVFLQALYGKPFIG